MARSKTWIAAAALFGMLAPPLMVFVWAESGPMVQEGAVVLMEFTITVPESQLDAVTAVSGSGPAYFFLMVEALVDAGVAAGLPRAVATDLAVQTMAGSAAMLLESLDRANPSGDGAMGTAMDTSPAQLRATVTSPGGTTAAGLRELERGGLRAAVAEAVAAAKTRSEQLGITPE